LQFAHGDYAQTYRSVIFANFVVMLYLNLYMRYYAVYYF